MNKDSKERWKIRFKMLHTSRNTNLQTKTWQNNRHFSHLDICILCGNVANPQAGGFIYLFSCNANFEWKHTWCIKDKKIEYKIN